ncbi:hypothetical protein [Phormidesmis priestleyi]
MSKTSDEAHNSDDEILIEYHFDYEKAKPNRFAADSEKQRLKVVVLDEDVIEQWSASDLIFWKRLGYALDNSDEVIPSVIRFNTQVLIQFEREDYVSALANLKKLITD